VPALIYAGIEFTAPSGFIIVFQGACYMPTHPIRNDFIILAIFDEQDKL
jgi:hypothetical protein